MMGLWIMQNKFSIFFAITFVLVSCSTTDNFVSENRFECDETNGSFAYEQTQFVINPDFFPTEYVIYKVNGEETEYYSFHYYEYKKEMINKFLETGDVIAENEKSEYENINSEKGEYYVKITGIVGNPHGNNVENPTVYFWLPDDLLNQKTELHGFKQIKDNHRVENASYVFEIYKQEKDYLLTYRFLYHDVGMYEYTNDYVQIIKSYNSGKNLIYEKQNKLAQKGKFYFYSKAISQSGEFKRVNLWF